MTTGHPLKILLIGDYSNCHRTLRDALRRRGHDVTLVSEGCGFQDTGRDIDISRGKSRLSGAWLYCRMRYGLRDALTGNDIVVLQNPHFAPLKPQRLRALFDFLRKENGSVFLTAAGTDCAYISSCLSEDYPLRYSEFRVNGHPTPFAVTRPDFIREWTTPEMRCYNDYIYRNINGVATALYEYDVAVRHYLANAPTAVEYCGIPIEVGDLQPVDNLDVAAGVRLFLGRHRGRLAEKGTDILEQAARIVVDKHPHGCSLEIVENLPYAEYVERQMSSHIVLDQIYSYTPATNAMIAMARGLNVVSGGEAEFYDFIGETENRPIINAPQTLDALVELLDDVVRHPEEIARRGKASRDFVLKHNDADVVAERYLNFWNSNR